MKFIPVLFMILFTLNSLEAYTKQIIFDKFKDKKSAEAALEKLKSYEIYEKLNIIATENDFTIHVISSNNENLLVAEPIKNQFIQEETMKLVLLKFEQATIKNLERANSAGTNKEFLAKIVFGTYSAKYRADSILKKLKKDELYKKLDTLVKENDLAINVRPLGKFYILAIEPIKDIAVYEEILNLMKSKFKAAYGIREDAEQYAEENPLTKSSSAKKEKSKTPKIVTAPTPELIKEEPSLQEDAVLEVEKIDKNSSLELPVVAVIQTEVNTTEINTTQTEKAEEPTFSLEALETKVVTEDASSESAENTSIVNSVLTFIGWSSEPETPLDDMTDENITEEDLKAAEEMIQAENEKEQKTMSEQDEESSFLDYFLYFLISVIAAVVIHFLIKFKRVYDTY